MIILGIDPGLQHTGWGVVSYENAHLKYLAGGVIHSNAKDTMAHRLKTLHDGLAKVIDVYKPNSIGIEEVYVNSNPRTSLKLGQARGMGFLAAANAMVDIHEYSPKEIKKGLVGTGNADKTQVDFMVKTLLPGVVMESNDMSDALAVAICHAHSLKSSLFNLKSMR
ncbi:MAG: Crossover junction endodeoxyribonuclease RuvC [Proteobacteria bacterium]|nr:MAG: Crossover junction endodeoxyribonuclease RuvC [Pseudomonadota bacterium]|tara:strand:+ start:364 stop:861 length:498 start_codon:yes stop_codon:yes gene_type:complete